MQIISNNTDFIISEPTVVSIGKFDGDHIGHQKIFAVMRQIKADEMLKSAAFSFAFFDTPQMSTMAEKRRLLKHEDVDYLIEFPFTDETKNMEAEVFIKEVLIARLNMKHIVAGTDCSFGHNRSGNADLLRTLGPELGFKVTIIEKVSGGNEEISSTAVRSLIRNGNVEKAAVLNGRPYTVSGIARTGNKLGSRKLGFGTANIIPEEGKLFPKEGVYLTKTLLSDGRRLYSMTNIGSNPSIDTDSFGHIIRCETHIFDFNEVLYGQFIQVEFLRHIRDEIRFSSVEELKAQLEKDRQYCLSLIDSTGTKV